MKEGSIPEDWKSSVVLPIYRGKGDPMECGSYRGMKLLEHAMKVVERIFEHRIRQQIVIDDMQFGFMKDPDAAVEARIRIGWNKFRQLVPLLANKDVSLIMRGRLYSSCV